MPLGSPSEASRAVEQEQLSSRTRARHASVWALPQAELDLGELFAWNARMREVVERHQPPAFHPSVDGPAGDLQEPCSLCRRHERRHRSRRLPRI